jgi:hypothetical protein
MRKSIKDRLVKLEAKTASPDQKLIVHFVGNAEESDVPGQPVLRVAFVGVGECNAARISARHDND